MNEKFYTCILIQISLKFVPKCPIDYKSASVDVMAWRQALQVITWTNANPIHLCINATLGGDELTLWGQVMHIWVLSIDDGLSPGEQQAEPMLTYQLDLHEQIAMKIESKYNKNCSNWKMLSAKFRTFYRGLNMLNVLSST